MSDSVASLISSSSSSLPLESPQLSRGSGLGQKRNRSIDNDVDSLLQSGMPSVFSDIDLHSLVGLPDGYDFSESPHHSAVSGNDKKNKNAQTAKKVDEVKKLTGPVVILSDGSSYVGDLKDGVPHGYGTLTCKDGRTYTGDFEFGNRHGHGTSTWPSKGNYVGDFKNDKLEGTGTIHWDDGNKYSGEFLNSLPHGKGAHAWLDGRYYEGEFVKGEIEGQGTFRWKDGRTYVGPFQKGLPHGHGSMKWKKPWKKLVVGDILENAVGYIGDFVNGLIEGKGTLFYANGDQFQGTFMNEEAQGLGVFIKANTSLRIRGHYPKINISR